MNKRLETEVDKIFERYDNSVVSTSPEEKERIKAVAEYFYNLALEDVKKGVRELSGENKQSYKETKSDCNRVFLKGISAGYAEVSIMVNDLKNESI